MAQAKKVNLDAIRNPQSTTQPSLTVAWLRAQGLSAQQAKEVMADYDALPTTGLKAGYRKRLNSELGIGRSPSAIAEQAAATRKGKAGNGKGSTKRSQAAKKAAATRKRNGS
jgi:hypothetical protein